jgi:hypothetical protein
MDDDAELDYLLRETAGMTTGQLDEYFRKRGMFDPPLPGSLIAGRPLCGVPDSDVKYKSFLEWWFAVGRKAPELTIGDSDAIIKATNGPAHFVFLSEGSGMIALPPYYAKTPQTTTDMIRSHVAPLYLKR